MKNQFSIGTMIGRRDFSILFMGVDRRGYVVASRDSQSFDDPGVFVEIPLVNQIRSASEGMAIG